MANNPSIVATIVPEEPDEGEKDVRKRCNSCGDVLVLENTGEATRSYGLCLRCLPKIQGEEMTDTMALLLAKGVIMTTHYKNPPPGYYRVRVDLRSALYTDMLQLCRDLGVGKVYEHSVGVSRWSVSSIGDLDKLGRLLTPYQPVLAVFLQRYAAQVGQKNRSAFAEAFVKKMGTRTVRIVQYI